MENNTQVQDAAAQRVAAALAIITAVGDAIRELKEVPSGHLYANHLMGKMTFEEYNTVISRLKGAGLIKEDGFHLLTWVGPLQTAAEVNPGPEPELSKETDVNISQVATANGIGSQDDLAKLTTPQLLAMWNGMPGVKPTKKFTNRAEGIKRIWKMAQKQMTEMAGAVMNPGADTAVAKPAPKAKAKAKVAKKAKAPKAKAAPKAKVAKKAKAPKAKGTKGELKGAKSLEVIRLLSRAHGATLEELMEKMEWQAHSVRGFISTLESKHGLPVESFKPEGGKRTYRINA